MPAVFKTLVKPHSDFVEYNIKKAQDEILAQHAPVLGKQLSRKLKASFDNITDVFKER
jgi:hypothetical protein